MRLRLLLPVLLLAQFRSVVAQAPAEVPPNRRPMKPVPPPGVAIPDADRKELEAGVKALGTEIESLKKLLAGRPLHELLPDVQIYYNAVHYALKYNEFYKTSEAAIAKTLLARGTERVNALRTGKAPWAAQTGPVVRGYVSRIDGSVQPYGLVIPPTYEQGKPSRLDFWLHGRGETLSELSFIAGREKGGGEFTPENAIVLHLYGRYCNASKFAGEVDLFEALDSVRRRYSIDMNRLVVRGFSMGGASAWHFATHYAGLWAAANPGAGFADTATYLNIAPDADPPTWYERKLWHLYDPVDYAGNLFNCPVIAYSGETDRQKLAADLMAEAMEKEGLKLTHMIGPNTGHKYEPGAKKKVIELVDGFAAKGRSPVPPKVRFTTWTLRYNKMLWVTVDALEGHWQRARVDAEISGPSTVTAKTENVGALTFSMPAGLCPLDRSKPPKVILDGTELTAPAVQADRSWTASFKKGAKGWSIAAAADDGSLRKRHGLQGPIDDAFMESFVMVRPTGQPMNTRVGEWVASEFNHATREWRAMFRGEARVVDDSAVTAADIADSNLVLWGDPKSNKVLARIADKLPVRWTADGIQAGDEKFSGEHHVPVLVYPNPLNPKRYVVVNSGVTFREADYVTNARQTPKLPDWAVIDVNTPPSISAPGKVVKADFFGESWELKAAKK